MSHKISTLTDFVGDYIASNFSVRPDTLESMAAKVRLAAIELQKNNIFPETTIMFRSLDMKEEKRDSADRLIYHFYELPEDFRQLYNKGPAFEVEGSTKTFQYMEYGDFLRILNSGSSNVFSIHRFKGEYGTRNRLIVRPFPADDAQVRVTYYSNGADMPMDELSAEYYMPVINHVLHQLGIKPADDYKNSSNEVKLNRQNPAGQGSYHNSFARTTPRYFGNHRRRGVFRRTAPTDKRGGQ